jgi:hypothetical protein
MSTESDAMSSTKKMIGFRMDAADAKRLKQYCIGEDESAESALTTLSLAWIEGLIDLRQLRAELGRRAQHHDTGQPRP